MSDISIKLSLESAQALAKLNGFLGSAADGLKRMALQVGAAYLGIHSFKELTTEVIHLGAQLDELSDRTKTSVVDLIAIKQVLKDSGASADAAGGMIDKMSVALVKAMEQGGDSARIFSDLHLDLSLTELAAKTAGEQFVILGNAIQKIENSAKRAQTLRTIFGRGGGELGTLMSKPIDLQKDGLKGQAEFADTLSKISGMMDSIGDDLNRLKEKGMQVGAGILSQLAPALQKTVDELASIDFTIIGKKFGAFVNVVINSWKENKFPEMIGLLIEAGFEFGFTGAESQFRKMWEALTGVSAGQFYLALVNAIITFGVKATQILIEALLYPVAIMSTYWSYVWDVMKYGFQGVVKFMAAGWEMVINGFISAWNKTVGPAIGKTFEKVSISGDMGIKAPSLGDTWKRELEATAAQGVVIVDYLQENLEKTREILGVNQKLSKTDDTRLTALQRLNALINEQIDLADSREKKEFKGSPIEVFNQDTLKKLSAYAQILREIYLQEVKLIDVNPFTTQLEKAKQILPLLEKQKQLVQESLNLASADYDKAGTEDDKIAAKKEMIKLQGELNDLNAQEVRLKALDSFSDQMKMAQVDLQNSWGSWAQQVATSFKTVFQGAINSISNGITGLIMRTKTWGQALSEIGTNILTEVVHSIVQMGVQWVMTHIIMKGAMVAFHAIADALGWSSATQVIAQEEAKAPALAANAATASVSSFGAAAIVGIALLVAGLGVGIAAATGAFRERGGPVTAGQPYIVGEKRPELFVPTQSGYIVPSVPAIQSLGSTGGGQGFGQAPNNTNVMVHFPDSAEAANRHARNNPEFHHIILDIAKRNSHIIAPKA